MKKYTPILVLAAYALIGCGEIAPKMMCTAIYEDPLQVTVRNSKTNVHICDATVMANGNVELEKKCADGWSTTCKQDCYFAFGRSAELHGPFSVAATAPGFSEASTSVTTRRSKSECGTWDTQKIVMSLTAVSEPTQ